MTDHPRFEPVKSGHDASFRHYHDASSVAFVRVANWWLTVKSAVQRGTARILSLAISSILCSALLCAASHVHAAEGDWTVVTMARDGSWGVATASSQGQGIAAAIRGCKAMAATQSDCGAQFTTIRGGWTLAKLCGDEKIIVTGETLQEAEQAALYRELDLSLFYMPALPPCRRLLTVDPHGTIGGSGLQHSGTSGIR